jgi:predicted NBD/HSP70 family sugar kinase
MRLGLDIGGTKIDAVVLDADDAVRSRVRVATGMGPNALLDSAELAVREVVERDGLDLGDVTSIGVGIPGMVDPATGHVRHAVNLRVTDLALAELLSGRVGAPVRLENDVKAAALGAYSLLGLTGTAALLNLGTGVAAGIVMDGTLWRGPGGGAGEVGHIPIDPSGVRCGCGQYGCIETFASGTALARMWPSQAPLPALELFDAADAGDQAAIDVRRAVAAGAASGVRVLVLTVDVQTVVIGGGLSNLGDRLLAAMTDVMRQWGEDSPFIASLGLPERVRMLPAEVPAAAVGAALVGAAAETASRPSAPSAAAAAEER